MAPEHPREAEMTRFRNRAALALAVLTMTGFAHAEYRCDAPPTPLDRRACEKAKEGPQALRRFVEAQRPLHSLYFFDYMTEAQLVAWRNGRRAIVTAPTADAPR
jgi:hypothetical protein